MGIEVRLLGRFTVLRDGDPLPPSAFRQRLVRTLIRLLLSRRGEFVPREFLIEALWPERTPVDPAANLRVLVALARKALDAPSLLQSSAGGYAFSSTDGCTVDAEIFLAKLQRAQDSATHGSHRAALKDFRGALEVWGGEPLAEDVYQEWAQNYRRRLLRAHLDALEGAAVSALVLGEPVGAVTWAEQAVAEEPLREQAHAILVEALAASGDTAKALEVLDSFRRLLADELGLDPSPETQLLHGKILRGEIAQHHTRQQGLSLPAELNVQPMTPFVGRAAELEAVSALYSGRWSERLAVTWLLGEPGIGKTRLASRVAQEVQRAGGVPLFGRCREEVQVPYGPFVEALHWYLSHTPDTLLVDRICNSAAELIRLAPEIGDRLTGMKRLRSVGPEIERYRLFEAVRSWLAAAGGGAPVILVVDDLHWADRATLELLAHLGRSAEPSPAMLVLTARNTQPDDREDVAALIDELDHHGTPTCRLELGGLSAQDVEELLAAAAGRKLDDGLRSLAAQLETDTGGNPLFLDLVLQRLAADSAERPEVEGSLRRAILRRVARLPDDVAEILRTASVVGLDFDVRVVAGVTGGGEPAVLRALEVAAGAGLVAEKEANVYRFRHALVRSVLGTQLSQSRRVRLHLAVGEAIEALNEPDLGHLAGTLCHHFVEALPVGGGPKAYRYTIMAAQHAANVLSHGQAVEYYRRALEILDELDEFGPTERYEVLTSMSEAQRNSGDVLGAVHSLRAASEDAAERDDSEHFAKAAISFEETTFWLGVPEDDARELLDRATATPPSEGSPLHALLLAAHSRALVNSGRLQGQEHAHQAMAIAERLGDPLTVFRVRFRTTSSTYTVQEADAGAALWTQLYREGRRLGETEAYLLALLETMWATVMLGDVPAADDLFAEYSRTVVQLRQPRWDYWMDVFRALRALIAGDLEAAERSLQQAERTGERFGWAREGLYGVAMYLIRREQGRLGSLASTVQAAAGLKPNAGLWQPGLAALLADLGRLDDAQRAYEDFLAQRAGTFPDDGSHDLVMSLLAEVCVKVGDSSRAPWFFEQLRPCRGKLVVCLLSAICLGPADRLLGLLATTAGDPEAGQRWLHSGLELARRTESPVWVAHCLFDYASHLQVADPAGAELMAAEAGALCGDYGFHGLGARMAAH